MKGQIDELDIDILRLLQNDARRSYKEIGKELGVSIGTVHNRITKLRESGILNGFSININNEKLGYKLCFIILIHIDGKHTPEVLEKVRKREEVLSCFHITGEQSAALICRFKELEDVQKFIRDLNQEEYIIRTVSNMVLKEYKSSSNIEL